MGAIVFAFYLNLDFAAKNDSETSMRSVNSDLETAPSNRKRHTKRADSVASETRSDLPKDASNRPLGKIQSFEVFF